jgi:hypothetical protein
MKAEGKKDIMPAVARMHGHSYRRGTIKNVMLRDNDDEDGLCCWLLFHPWSLGMDDLMDLRKGGV